jgi:hypothetical protein
MAERTYGLLIGGALLLEGMTMSTKSPALLKNDWTGCPTNLHDLRESLE